jgi:hypothetical protein
MRSAGTSPSSSSFSAKVVMGGDGCCAHEAILRQGDRGTRAEGMTKYPMTKEIRMTKPEGEMTNDETRISPLPPKRRLLFDWFLVLPCSPHGCATWLLANPCLHKPSKSFKNQIFPSANCLLWSAVTAFISEDSQTQRPSQQPAILDTGYTDITRNTGRKIQSHKKSKWRQVAALQRRRPGILT